MMTSLVSLFACGLVILVVIMSAEVIKIQFPYRSNAVISDDVLSDSFNSNLTQSNLLPTVLVSLKDPNQINATITEQISSILNTLIKNNLTLTSLNYSKELNLASFNVTEDVLSPINITEYDCQECITTDSPSWFDSWSDFLFPDAPSFLSITNHSIENRISNALQDINSTGVGTPELDQVFIAQYENAQIDSSSSPLVKKASQSQIIPNGFSRIEADIALSKLNSSEPIDVDIAIVDSGINPHPDLNIFNHKTFVADSSTDTCGHGTHVAGIAAAKNNSFGVIGTAPGARLWDVKVLNNECESSKDSLLKGLWYVLDHKEEIEVVNLSLGTYCDPSLPQLCNSNTVDKLISAISRHMVVVAASGNGITDFLTDKKKPDDSVNWKPAKFDNIVAVSNFVDSDGKCGGHGNITYRGMDDFMANTSNFGEVVDIAAPGVKVLSTSNNGSYVYLTGTSMSSPLVAGTAALYKSLHPDESPDEIIARLSGKSIQMETECEGAHGYLAGGDLDNYPEPVLNLVDLIP